MLVRSTNEPHTDIESLIQEVIESHEELHISGRSGKAVLLSEDDWRSIQETLYLQSIPGMSESIKQGLAEPLDECEEYRPDEMEDRDDSASQA